MNNQDNLTIGLSAFIAVCIVGLALLSIPSTPCDSACHQALVREEL